ncbi:DNA adenine methylase [Alkalibacillus sp. S2W]|uniref:DNA adenine methylase n=1 Tax=Alkalibacillus sp. S2W TaxID=3386553 RepID=UPI00398CE587
MDNLQPFLKWAGGKRQLLPEIRKYIPENYNNYYEPFVGAGAVLFDLEPSVATINDINEDLVKVYNVIKYNIDGLLEDLKKHKNQADYFYEIRSLDRTDEIENLSEVERASRIIYLNKTCYNGLFRVNSKGEFNVPFGRYKNPGIVNEEVLRTVHKYLNENNITVLSTDFTKAVETASEGDFVYFDPPYHPISPSSSFTGYSLGGFSEADQKRLRDTYLELHHRGCYVMLSNSNSEFIKEIYDHPDLTIKEVQASRNINSDSNGRGKISEVLILNYGKENEE